MRTKLVVLLLLVFGFSVHAQGGPLNYGDNAVGSLSAISPLNFFSFSGTEGDRVTIVVIGITPGIDPIVSLLSPFQQQLAVNDNDPTSPGSTDARVTVTLGQSGMHTILVNSVNNAPGDYLIRLFGQPAAASTDVSETGAAAALAGTTQVFSFNASPDTPLTLNVSTTTPGFEFVVRLFSPAGQAVAISSGTAQVSVALNVPPGIGVYTAEISPVYANIAGEIAVSVNPVGQTAQEPPPPDSTAAPVLVVSATPIPQLPTATSETPLEQPSPTFTVTSISLEQPTATTEVQPEQPTPTTIAATVPPEVATATLVPPPTTVPPTATFVPPPTATFTAPPPPTATFTPSYTPPPPPTVTYTPSYTPTTPPPPPVAPEDARFNSPLNIPLDSTISVTDFVSYPEGDTEDRVRWDITGMNSNTALSGGRARLIIAVSCFGTGTDNVQFFTGGQTYSCGQTIVDREVTFDSRTGQVTITAIGGTGTYVQWVLTGTATRTN